jgi:hypothetical protein
MLREMSDSQWKRKMWRATFALSPDLNASTIGSTLCLVELP